MRDIAVTKWGNNTGFTPLTVKGQAWLDFHDVRNFTNRVWITTLIVGPGKAEMVLKALEAQTDVTILLEVEEPVKVAPVSGEPVKVELDKPTENVQLNLDIT